jgi:hypothetical protein
MKTCNNCTPTDINVSVPYVVHEAEVSRQERQIKRMWIALIVLAVALFLTNMAWIGYESQFETISYDYTQDGEGTNIIGDSNEVNNGSEIESENQTQEEE